MADSLAISRFFIKSRRSRDLRPRWRCVKLLTGRNVSDQAPAQWSQIRPEGTT